MLRILYKDNDIAVCVKPTGISSADTSDGMPAVIKRELGHKGDVYTVHRLDKAVGGLMVYALNAQSAAKLSRDISERRMDKIYLAVVHGVPAEPSGRFDDLLFHDSSRNKTYIVKNKRKGVREASLEYDVIGESGDFSLVRVRLLTGRTHQIRAQFSSRGMPLAGDGRYGGHDSCPIALWSCGLSLAHPSTGERMKFELPPDNEYPWTIFDELNMSDYK